MSREEREMARGLMERGELGQSVEAQRADFNGRFSALPMGDDVTLTPRTLGGVPALDVAVDGADGDGDGVILYLHGGAYAIGTARTGANLAAPLARQVGVPAVSLDYRLAPEDPFPAGVEDALAAYRELIGQKVVLAGDSAGGGLALALLLAARRAGLPLPAGAVLFSPWTDLTMSGASLDTDADPLFTRAHLAESAASYLGDADPADELASPLLADLTGLPPLLIQVGTAEVLLDDSLRLVTRAAECEVDVSLDVVAGAPHVFQYFAGMMPEADEALAHAATFLRARLAE